MSKILILNANRAGIGTYHRALNFGRALACAGNDVKMITISVDRRFTSKSWRDQSGLEIVEGPNLFDALLPWHASGPLDIALRTKEIIGGHYDLVYAFEYQPNVSFPVAIGRLFRKFPVISDWCDWHAGAAYQFGGRRWAHAIDRVFEEWIRRKANHVTVINNVLLERALAIGIHRDRITVIHEGTDVRHIKPHDRSQSRSHVGLPANAFIVGTIKDSRRAHEILLEAIGMLSHSIPNIHLFIVGESPEGVRQGAEQFGVGNRVTLPGRVTDEALPHYLASADVLALPLEDTLTNRGRWPHKLGDMIAAQRPVVTCAAGQFPELLCARGCARLAAFSPDAFRDAILDLATNPIESEAMALRGREFAVNELSWDLIGAQVARVVEMVI